MLIYKSTNLISNKSYIGKTETSLNIRIKSHKHQSLKLKNTKCIFHNSIHKHGFNNFIWEIIEDNIQDKTILNERETFYILKYDTFMPNGYNMSLGGEGLTGFKHHKESKERISKWLIDNNPFRGKHHTEETKEKISNANRGNKYCLGQHPTKETRNKMSESAKIKIFTDEHKKHISKSLLGNKHLLGHKHSEETKEKMRNSHKNRRPYSEESKQKMVEARKIWWDKKKGLNLIKV